MAENNNIDKKNSQPIYITAAILGAITLAVALLLAVLNSFTAPVIADRLKAEKEEAVASIFGGEISDINYTYLDALWNDPISEVLKINKSDKNGKDGEFLGYCVTVTPKGFNGKIIMLVAVNPNCTVKDTAVLSMGETAGQGTKIDSEEWFQEQFKNKTKNITIGGGANSIDTVANATVSSRAFTDGVNAALAVVELIEKDGISETSATSSDENTVDITTDTSTEVTVTDLTEEVTSVTP